jgi:hypothetical protein
VQDAVVEAADFGVVFSVSWRANHAESRTRATTSCTNSSGLANTACCAAFQISRSSG